VLDILKSPIAAIQDFYVLAGRSIANVFVAPHYVDDITLQMDNIGVGSLSIVVLTAFSSGLIITMQMARALDQYGATGQVGQIVALTLVRELGPLLTALLAAGRNASGIASELGSMKVTEQIDAMRAMGVDPSKKLVTPRVVATVAMLFFLSIISDLVGLTGGFAISATLLGLDANQYWTTAYQSLRFGDVVMGLTKPTLFGYIIATIGCYYGLSAKGGTQGVGRATTQAVVAASVLILVSDFFLTRLLMGVFHY
jgi:phospholipid/cholesterol/gamma-HCH transport system permease protein